MTKKAKQSKKAAKGSKRAKVLAQAEDETETDNMSAPTEVPQATPASQEVKIAVESQQPVAQAAPAAPATPVILSAPNTRSEAAKANIKEGLRLHQIAGRPTKQQLILVFGKAGYLLTWPKRTEKFGITPETFQAALAKGIPAVPLTQTHRGYTLRIPSWWEPMAILPGLRLGPYEILSAIGAGGMGVVYKAEVLYEKFPQEEDPCCIEMI